MSEPHQHMTGGHRQDGFIEVVVADDRLEARASFHPPLDEGALLTNDYIGKMLEKAGVQSGILWEAINETMFACNTERHLRENVLVARANPAVPELPAHFKLEEKFLKSVEADSSEKGGKIDFRKRHSYLLVHRGEVLAVEIPAQAGSPGIDVAGSEIPPARTVMETLNPGRNTRLHSGKVVATAHGHFLRREASFWVEDTLEITGDVDYSSGHIEYPGDVVVQGEVHEGFRIAAAGNISCNGVVEVTELLCKKNFTAKAGLIGRGSAIIRVAGTIQAKYAENCHIEALKSVLIKGGIFNCAIFTLGGVDAGEKGRIVGGDITSLGPVSAGQIGKEIGVSTSLTLGVNFVVDRRLRLAREKREELLSELHRIEETLRSSTDIHLFDRREKILAELKRLEAEEQQLLVQLHPAEPPVLTIHGRVFPGTFISMLQASHQVTSVRQRVRFVYDPEMKRIKEEALAK
jgi:uncharacterized protein